MHSVTRFLALAVVCLFAVDALADAAPIADPAINLAMFYPVLAGLAGLVPGMARQLSNQDGFWHTTLGHAVITVLGGAAGVVVSVLTSGHVTKYAFVSAAISAVTAWALAFKTEGKLPTATALLIFLLPLGGLGCAGCQIPAQPTSPQYTAALEQCLEKDGVKDATDVGSKIFAILSSGASQADMLQQLEALGIPTAGEALELVAVCSIDAWMGQNPVQTDGKPTTGQVVARLFQASHAKTATAVYAAAPAAVSLAFPTTTGKAGTTATISAVSPGTLHGTLLVASDTQKGEGTAILDIVVNGQSTFSKALQARGIPTSTFDHNTFGYGNRLALPLCPTNKTISIRVKFLHDSQWKGTLSGTR